MQHPERAQTQQSPRPQPFLEIEPESHHRAALAAISLACLLLVAIKANALLQYWQQTHHIFMTVSNLPSVDQMLPRNATLSHWHNSYKQWVDEGHQRLLLAGQLLLVGDKVLPEPELPVVAIPKCPEPVAPAQPICPTMAVASDTQPVPQLSASLPVAASIHVAADTQATAAMPATEPAAELGSPNDPASGAPSIDLDSQPEPTPEQLQAAGEPIGLYAGDRILLVGDSLMQGVAPHLISALKRNYKVESMDLSRHSTGLTYPAFFDWPATVKDAFELENYHAVIVFLGANDPWDMNLQGRYVRFGTERWREVYSARVAQIMRTVAEHNARLIWLGAPPMGREDLVGKEPLLNEIYASEAAKYPLFARFVATAPGLSLDGSSFTKFLELPDRGNVMVRTDDGVHFTTQGQKLLAKLALAQFRKATPQQTAQPAAIPDELPVKPQLDPASEISPDQLQQEPPNPASQSDVSTNSSSTPPPGPTISQR